MYGLNPRIRAQVRMWKPTSVVEEIECARYTKEMLGGKPLRTFNTSYSGFVGKAPQTYSKGGYARPPPYGNKYTPIVATIDNLVASSIVSQYTTGTHQSERNY